MDSKSADEKEREKRSAMIRRIYRERGYIVIWQHAYQREFKIGEAATCGAECFNWGARYQVFTVRQETDEADFLAQQALSRRYGPRFWKHAPPEKYIGEVRNGTKRFYRIKAIRQLLKRSA